jgi:hypothetical protein
MAPTGRPVTGYPPEVLAALQAEAEEQDKRYTHTEIKRRTGRSNDWTRLRLKPLAALRRTPMAGYADYPQSVLDAVMELAKWKKTDIAPVSGDWYPVDRLSAAVGEDEDWVVQRLPEFELLAMPRFDPRGVMPHYPPAVRDALMSLK